MRIGLLAEKIGMTRFYDKDKINHSCNYSEGSKIAE